MILAAGASRRFGSPKQLAELDGRPLLEHAIAAMAAVPAIARIVVVLGAHAAEIRAGVDLGAAEAIECPDWDEGQAASLRCAITAVADAEIALITLGDQPRITPQVIARFADKAAEHGAGTRARAVYAGTPGHPVALGRRYFDDVRALRGDTGARDLLRTLGAHEIECGRLCSADDVDTPDQLEAIRT